MSPVGEEKLKKLSQFVRSFKPHLSRFSALAGAKAHHSPLTPINLGIHLAQEASEHVRKEDSMTLASICNQSVVTIRPRASAAEAARKMKNQNVGCLVVLSDSTEATEPIGILTDRDLVLALTADDVVPSKIWVEDLMIRHPVTVNLNTDIYETAKIMHLHGVRRLPVVDDEGGLCGIISADDLSKVLTEQMAQVCRIVDREIANEKNQEHLQQRWL